MDRTEDERLIAGKQVLFFFSSRRRHTRYWRDWSSDVCSSDLDRAAALERHMEFFNTHPYVAAPIIGVTLALEEERANGTAIDNAAIQGVKIGMMGPLAGIGDPVFWFTVRPILGALGASLARSEERRVGKECR